MTVKNNYFLFVSLFFLVVLAGNVHAALLYSNGPVTGDSGYCDQGPGGCGLSETDSLTLYDNFQVLNDSHVTGFDYNDYIHNGSSVDYINTVWSIWDVDPSVPFLPTPWEPTPPDLQPLYSGVSVASLSDGALDSYLFTVSDLELNLSSGIYWLAISNTVTSGTITTYALSDNSGLSGEAFTHSIHGYVSTHYDRAFNVYGSPVPVPASLWLLSSGVIGVFGLAKRKRT